MKNLIRTLIPLLATAAISLPVQLSAQDGSKKKNVLVDRRDQADGWYLPVRGEVTVNGEKSEGVTVKVFKENEEVGTFPADKKGGFNLELDLDFVFTLLIQKEGCQNKMIYVDTHLPENLVQYPAYECFVNMEPEGKTAAADPFYLDFPSAIVRYSEEMGGYYHSDIYLQHINNKMHNVAQASF